MDEADMKPFSKRAKIKEAFEELKNYLLIQDYQCEKKEQGYLFSYCLRSFSCQNAPQEP